MPRYSRPPISNLDLFTTDGPPIRVRDLCALLGWSRPRVHRAIESGELAVLRPHDHARATVYIQREEARRWLLDMGWQVFPRGTVSVPPGTRNLTPEAHSEP